MHRGRGKSFETGVVSFVGYSHLFVKIKHALFKHLSSNQNKVFSYILCSRPKTVETLNSNTKARNKDST